MEHLLKTKDMQLTAAHNRTEALQAEVQAGQSRAEALEGELALRCAEGGLRWGVQRRGLRRVEGARAEVFVWKGARKCVEVDWCLSVRA